MKRKTHFLSGFLLGMLAVLVVVAGIGVGMVMLQENKEAKSIREATEKKVDYLEKLIDAYYLEDVDQKQLETGVYKGLVAGLGDPYSVYYTAEEYKELQEDTSGIYCGIGSVVSQDTETGVITAVKVFKDAPADKAGMKNGDVIFKVEDQEVTGEDLNKVVAGMKGKRGTKVKITVYRSAEEKYLDLTVTRDEVNVPTVEGKMLDQKKGIGYIQISQFDEVTYDQFTEVFQKLKKQGMKGVIFDTRDNPGGLYHIVCKMLDDILPEGTIVYTKDKYGKEEKQTSDARCLKMPIIVLQNENSASASEIFAGAIQDFGAGQIVGTQSFGKGIVQTIIKLDDGSAVKLTIEKYYTPKGTNIHGKGITPDVEIKAGVDTKEDIQLNKAKEVLEGLMRK